jgi:branched-subunit amino acid transport protein
MVEVWATVAGLAVTTALIRASGPVVLGGRELPRRVMDVIALVAAALLAALVVVETFAEPDGALELDPRAAGVASAGLVVALRGGMIAAVTTAAVVAALLRAIA